jgi:hypothetical protein
MNVDSLRVFWSSWRVFANYEMLGNVRHDARGALPEGGVRICQVGKTVVCAKLRSHGRARDRRGLKRGDEGTWGVPLSGQGCL